MKQDHSDGSECRLLTFQMIIKTVSTKFGATQPNVQKLQTDGSSSSFRVSKKLERTQAPPGNGKAEFWETQ